MERILHCGQNCPENISEKGVILQWQDIVGVDDYYRECGNKQMEDPKY